MSTFAFSASWMLVVDHWPPSDRPYIGGSSDNTVQDLVLGYNGFGRVEGEAQGFRGGGPAPNPRPGPNQPQGQGNAPRVLGGNPPTTAAAVTPGVEGFNRPAQVGPPGAGGPGGIIAGAPGLWRMFDAANGGQIAWFLPFALLSSVVSLWWWRKDLLRRALIVLFVGWVILFAGVFSYAQGIYHSYYTSAMAPGVVALVGVGTVGMSRAIGSNRLWVLAAAIVIGATIWVQLTVTGRSPGFYDWVRPLMVWTAVAGVVAAAALALRRWPVTPALMMSVVALVALPAAWAMNEVESMSLNTTLPQAGPLGGAAGRSFGSEASDDGTASRSWPSAGSAVEIKRSLLLNSLSWLPMATCVTFLRERRADSVAAGLVGWHQAGYSGLGRLLGQRAPRVALPRKGGPRVLLVLEVASVPHRGRRQETRG